MPVEVGEIGVSRSVQFSYAMRHPTLKAGGALGREVIWLVTTTP